MNSQFNHPTLNRKQKNKEMKQHIAHGFMHFLMFYVLRKLHWATICKTVRPMLSGRCPSFRPMSIVAKRSHISATAEHFFILLYVHCKWSVDPYAF